MVLIFNEKKNKQFAKKISSYLNSKGYTTWTEAQNKNLSLDEAIKKAQFFILIFDQDSNKSKRIIEFYDKVFETSKPLILFVVSDLEYSLSMQYFLDENYWIDAYNNNFKVAVEALEKLLKEISNEKNTTQTKSSKSEQPKNTNSKKTITYTLIAVFAIIIGYFIFLEKQETSEPKPQSNTLTSNGQNTENQSLTNNQIIPNKDELFREYLIGKWKLTDYNDSQLQMLPEDQRQSFMPEIERLKKEFYLILNPDNTFLRIGFQRGSRENGFWNVDPQNKVLLLSPPNAKDFSRADKLKIQKLTAEDLILVIASKDNLGNQVVTVLTFKKVK